MAIAKAGQKAYNSWGDEATLTEDFLARDYKTWEGGLVSINHENNNEWVKAKIYDIEYDAKEKLVICSFSGIPYWLMSLIYSEDYRGTSQECIPIEFRKNSMDVVKGYGTGVTIVTDPYEPAANQSMGVGIPPALAAILASKYPTQIEVTMVDKTGGGTAAVSVEAFETTVSENVQLKSTIKVLETMNADLEKELASWKQKYTDLESGEVNRTKIAVESALAARDAELKAEAEREAVVSELRTVMSKDCVESYLATNPSLDQIKSITGILKVNASKGIGSPTNSGDQEQGKSYE
ncbi:MAG: hypothetical protein ABFD07_04560, partial [Methanobacterium sp.]